MGLTKISTDGVKDDAVTTDKLANAINTERTANTAKVSTTINNNADNRVITGSGTANTLEGESTLTYDGTSLLLGSGSVATKKVTQAGSLDLDSGGISLCIGGNENSNGRTDGTNKANRIAAPHRTNAEEPTAIISAYNATNENQLFYGGGSSLTNAVTSHHFYTAADTTTTTGTERMRIRQSGEVHIGTIEGGADRGASAIKSANDGAGNPISVYFQEASGAEGYGVGVDSDGDLNFHNSASTTPTLEVRDDNNVAVTLGNLVVGTAGKGIDFSETTDAAGGTSELLDDYEEGTWTPNIRNDGATNTWTTQQGRYVKIGQQVTVWFNADGGSTPRSGGGSGALIMTGLPFSQVIFGNPILGVIGANDHASGGLYSTSGLILNAFGQGGTQVRFGVGGQSANFGINYAAGSFTYTAS